MTPQTTDTTAAPAKPSLGHTLLTDLEKVAIGVVAAAPSTAPVFVHSDRGIAIFNASEALFASILAQFANKGA